MKNWSQLRTRNYMLAREQEIRLKGSLCSIKGVRLEKGSFDAEKS